MLSKNWCFALFLASLTTFGQNASAQANITGSLSASIYVDAGSGSDSHSGTSSSPLKTIQAAIYKATANTRRGIGTKVVVEPGVYRESVNISGSRNAQLAVEASVAGKAIIAGSNVLTGWNHASSNVYTHSFSSYAECPVPSGWPTTFAPIGRRREMFFVNGVPYTQVMSEGALLPGTFYVSGSEVYIDSETDIENATVEAAVRSTTLTMENSRDVVLQGLVLRHASTCMNVASATISGSTDVLVNEVQAIWNSWGGLNVSSGTNVTVENSIGSFNGGIGFMGDDDVNLLLNYNETDHNNWRGAQAAFYDWAMGGTKMFGTHTVSVQKQFSYGNQAQGLWFDTDNRNITINDATLAGNRQAALQLERNQGPILLENSHLCSSGLGLNILTVEGLTIKNNTFYNNGGTASGEAEIFLQGTTGGQEIRDWQTGASYHLYTENLVSSGNTFENAGTDQNVFGTYLDSSDFSRFADSLKSSNNKWYDPNTSSNFKMVEGKLVNISGWQSAVRTDYSSSWSKPSSSPEGACSLPSPTFADFSVNVDKDNYTMSSGAAVSKVRVNSFGYGTVDLKVTGLPSHVSASLSRGSLVSGDLTLTIRALSGASHTRVPLTLVATSGSRVHTVTFYVNVS